MATTYVRNIAGEFELVSSVGVSTDTTLLIAGRPADAAAVGRALENYSPQEHEHTNYARIKHDHNEYALLAHSHNEYALNEHNHGEYALIEHEHIEYVSADAPTFTTSINMGRKAESEIGYDSVAIGRECVASLDYCVAIGDTAIATNYGAIAIGTDVTARGIYSYAEGYQTQSIGYVSHAEGAYTEATGDYSHVEGCGTIANVYAQHVQGRYNIKDEEYKYLHIVGNGESESTRSNAHTIDKNGNGWFAGSVECDGLILTSPNGTRYRVSVNNSGTLSAAIVEE